MGENRIEDPNHGLLKKGGSSFESKRKDCSLEMMVGDRESGFGSVSGVDPKLPETRLEVKFE